MSARVTTWALCCSISSPSVIASIPSRKGWHAEVVRAGEVLLCKPLTYMNCSGQAVQPLCHFYKISPAETLVVLDDMALPLGKLRLRTNGSAGGHNGLQSIIDHVRTHGHSAFAGRDWRQERAGRRRQSCPWQVPADELTALEESLDRAVAAIDCAQTKGFEAAMNGFN